MIVRMAAEKNLPELKIHWVGLIGCFSFRNS